VLTDHVIEWFQSSHSQFVGDSPTSLPVRPILASGVVGSELMTAHVFPGVKPSHARRYYGASTHKPWTNELEYYWSSDAARREGS
jgi:hypothetical protein